ncbi:hypothetical protein ACROYT_G019755 [Oculina patagonica]
MRKYLTAFKWYKRGLYSSSYIHSQWRKEFKVFLLCFAVLVAATSVCKCEDKKETASKYKVKIKDGDKEVDEEIEVDTEKQTETLHVPKTDSGNAGEVDVVYDFKKNLTMHRLSAAKACFLSESTEDMPKPDDLIKLLDQQSNAPARNGTNSVYDAVSELTDRSDLSDEMASLCAKLPIYRVKKAMFISQRVKRFTFDFTYLCCDTYCYNGERYNKSSATRRTKNCRFSVTSENMEFKVFLLCFAVLVAATSVCKCEDKKETASKYKVKIKDGDKEVDEEIEVDTEKQTETLHVPKTNSGNAGEVDVVYDFKKNLTMHRLSAAKACFLSESTEDMPKPDDLVKLLDQQSNAPARNGTNSVYDAVSELTDRSDLSDEMASLCAKLPIYRVKKATFISQRSSRDQEFKMFLLCFAVLVVATSAATVCKCEDKKETVSKYKVKIKDGDKEIDEEIEVDTEKQTETLHVPKTDSGNAGEVDIVYDFKKNLTMHRLSAAKACFLSESTEDMPKPDDLVKLLDQQSTTPARNGTNSVYEVVSTVTDRSDLSDEMASLCAKLPIYRVKKMSRRVKRLSLYAPCYNHCYWYISWCYSPWRSCYPCYKRHCYWRCW